MSTENAQDSDNSTCPDTRSTHGYASTDVQQGTWIAEADHIVNTSLIQDVNSVLYAARPSGDSRMFCAKRFADKVYEKLEAIISSMQQDDGAGAGAKRSCKDSSLDVESAQKKNKSVGGIVSASSLVLQDSEQTDMASHSPLIQWILVQSNLADSSTPESRVPDIHSGISAFVEFVGEALTEVAAEEAYGNNIRKLCAFQNVDTIATGPDNHRQIDIAQTTTANPVPSHKNAIIVSVKQFAHEQHK
ncbi:hypothetical protein IW137_005160, partial [Coemansia sp. RSA 1287]